MSALVGLELANARASLAALARSPSRLLLWAPYLLLAVLFAFQRAEAGPVLAHAFGASQVVLVGGLLLATLGMSIIAGLRNAPFTYRNRAEPFVFAVAGLNVRTICTWLQLRALAGSVGLVVGRLLYLIIIFAPRGTTARGYLGSVVALALVVALLAVIRLPVHLARNVASIPLFAIGAASAACGALLAVAGFAAQVAPSMLARWTFLTVDSTNVLHAAPTLAAAVACAAALAVGSAFFANEELLAELYRATEARIARRERATGRGARFVRR
ncbi:MAG: hypothetical protein ACREM6_14900, partial [Vulcanimicrobiaceae bacterium]